MNKIVVVLQWMLILSLSGCAKVEVKKEYFPDGKLMAEKTIRGSSTVTKAYLPDGTLIGEYRHKNGKQHGISKMYYNDGKLFKVVKYKNGNQLQIKQYDKNGLLMAPK